MKGDVFAARESGHGQGERTRGGLCAGPEGTGRAGDEARERRSTVSAQGHAARFVTNSDFPAFKGKPPIFVPSREIQNPIIYHLNVPAWKQQINYMGTPRMGHK